jgi:hypothetical protein
MHDVEEVPPPASAVVPAAHGKSFVKLVLAGQ